MSKIKMRVNNDKTSVCEQCEKKYMDVKEMYDIKIFDELHTICCNCVDDLFHKTLSAQCKYNARLKSNEDMERIRRSDKNEKVW